MMAKPRGVFGLGAALSGRSRQDSAGPV